MISGEKLNQNYIDKLEMSAGVVATTAQTYDHLLKLVLVGDSAVGKSNILSRFSGHSFKEGRRSTIGVEFASKITNVCGTSIKSQM
jgi:GTPase SAR1 family protein